MSASSCYEKRRPKIICALTKKTKPHLEFITLCREGDGGSNLIIDEVL